MTHAKKVNVFSQQFEDSLRSCGSVDHMRHKVASVVKSGDFSDEEKKHAIQRFERLTGSSFC